MPHAGQRTRNRLLKYLTIPPGYKKLLHRWGKSQKGQNLLKSDWDICIILDACRADLLMKLIGNHWQPPQPWTASTITSLDSATVPWIRKTFEGDAAEGACPVTYVTSNPYSTRAQDSTAVNQLDEVWRYAWNSRLETVPPQVVTDRTIHHYRNGTDRVMAHYIQPHTPHLTEREGMLHRQYKPPGRTAEQTGESIRKYWRGTSTSIIDRFLPGSWDVPNEPYAMFERLKFGDLSHEDVWNSYSETLMIALEQVETVLRAVDAEQVLITSDHGEGFGEWGIYKHPYHMPIPALREVPYILTSASNTTKYQPETYDQSTKADTDERLEALGYV